MATFSKMRCIIDIINFIIKYFILPFCNFDRLFPLFLHPLIYFLFFFQFTPLIYRQMFTIPFVALVHILCLYIIKGDVVILYLLLEKKLA